MNFLALIGICPAGAGEPDDGGDYNSTEGKEVTSFLSHFFKVKWILLMHLSSFCSNVLFFSPTFTFK